MAQSLITDEGKTEVLRLAFKNDTDHGAFNFMALGGNSSSGYQDGNFNEVTDTSYHREETDVTLLDDKQIQISATFDETNLNISDGEIIKEIGLVNSLEYSSEEIFFAYCEVPKIEKNDVISLKYTVVIEIE
ncbi:MAG: hypothetical protein J6A15_00935 [Clostridia bacterium]|nr:hypothetical protein [Clostridia bacterium]